MEPIDTRRWFRVMLCFPIEVLADDADHALDEAMDAFVSTLNEDGLDVAHDLLASDANDVYEIDPDDAPTN